jgi:hypothetical protein
MITLTEVRRSIKFERTLTSSFPRDEISREQFMVNPANVALIEPHASISGIQVSRIVINAGGSTVSKIVEGSVSAIRETLAGTPGLLNG